VEEKVDIASIPLTPPVGYWVKREDTGLMLMVPSAQSIKLLHYNNNNNKKKRNKSRAPSL